MNHTPHSDKSVRRCLIAATIALFAATSPPSSVEPIVRDVQVAPAPLPASVPTARALLDAVSRYIGTAERLERIRSYRIESHGTQRFRALLSQEWIELPIVATVFWRDNLSARWTLTETIVDADGNDAIARREVGRVGDVSWTRDERDKCAEYLRISNLSDTVERNDPFRVLLREIPCHSQSFTEANIVGETTIDGRPCLRVDVCAPCGYDDRRTRSLWIDSASGELLALRTSASDARTDFTDWRIEDGVRLPRGISTEALFGGARISADVAKVTFNDVADDEIVAPTNLHDPNAVLSAEKQRSTSDS